MTNISVKQRPAFTTDSRTWLASPHGTESNAMPGITVDTSLFDAAAKEDGFIHSGVKLGRVTATGLYGPYDAAAVDGRENFAGLLFQAISTVDGDQKFGTGLFVHGFVFGAKLPEGEPDQAVKDAAPLIYWMDV